jgi:hypothetical protein
LGRDGYFVARAKAEAALITLALIIGSNRQILSLIYRPFDWVEGHSPSEHFRFEIGCMFLPLGGLPHAKPRFFAKPIQLVVSSQRPTRAKMHHGEGVVCERVIVHRRSNCSNIKCGLVRDGRSISLPKGDTDDARRASNFRG